MITDHRDEFEAAYRSKYPNLTCFRAKFALDEFGEYADTTVEVAWQLWQAALSLSQEVSTSPDLEELKALAAPAQSCGDAEQASAQTGEREPKRPITEEWCMNMARLEGDSEIGACDPAKYPRIFADSAEAGEPLAAALAAEQFVAPAPGNAEPPHHIIDAAMDVARYQYGHGVTRASIVAVWKALGSPWYIIKPSCESRRIDPRRNRAHRPCGEGGGMTFDWNASYEWLAEQFRRDTGLMAPGKDSPMQSYHDDLIARRKAWDEWMRPRREQAWREWHERHGMLRDAAKGEL